jgi:hypothetical protein
MRANLPVHLGRLHALVQQGAGLRAPLGKVGTVVQNDLAHQ